MNLINSLVLHSRFLFYGLFAGFFAKGILMTLGIMSTLSWVIFIAILFPVIFLLDKKYLYVSK